MRVARIASRAVTAIIQRADDHFLALLEAFRIGIHNARHLMPNDPRRADPRVHIAVVIHAKGLVAAEMRGGHGCCHLEPSQETDRGALRRVVWRSLQDPLPPITTMDWLGEPKIAAF